MRNTSPAWEIRFGEAELRWFYSMRTAQRHRESTTAVRLFHPSLHGGGSRCFRTESRIKQAGPEAHRKVIRRTRPTDTFTATSDTIWILIYLESSSACQWGARKFTCIKNHRITGRTPNKQIYVPGWAEGAADLHAGYFMVSRAKQIQHLIEATNIEPLVLSPFDAELFGHWWYEGPRSSVSVLPQSDLRPEGVRPTTASAYLENDDTLQMIAPSPSSWGHKGFWEVWLDESNSWIYPHLHAAARRMTEAARACQKEPAKWKEPVLRQMARELCGAIERLGFPRKRAPPATTQPKGRGTTFCVLLASTINKKAVSIDEKFL